MILMDRLNESPQAHERRLSPRTPIHRPVKLQCAQTGRMIAGQSVNVSGNGLLIEFESRPAMPKLADGQSVKVTLAWSSQQMLVKASNLQSAHVVRSWQKDGCCQVALRLDAAWHQRAA